MSEKRYLNSFTILSYNPNNVDVTFKAETLLIGDENDDTLLDIDSSSQNNNSPTSQNDQSSKEYWIINKDGKNKITTSSIINLENFNLDQIKAGPFFSIDLVVLYLNYFNDMELIR